MGEIEVKALQDTSFEIKEGEFVVILGPSGSGKSTIVGLLEAWFSPQSGTITLDGHKIEHLNIQWLRTNIRLVQQVGFFFLLRIFIFGFIFILFYSSAAVHARGKC